MQIPEQEKFEQDCNLLQRLRGAKIDGFEGVKMLNLKINRKRKAKGDKPINLEEDCAEDLELRKDD